MPDEARVIWRSGPGEHHLTSLDHLMAHFWCCYHDPNDFPKPLGWWVENIAWEGAPRMEAGGA